MTEKQLKRLKRTELLEILFFMRKEIETLQQENAELKEKLDKYSSGGNMILSDANMEMLTKAVESAVAKHLGGSVKRNNNKKR